MAPSGRAHLDYGHPVPDHLDLLAGPDPVADRRELTSHLGCAQTSHVRKISDKSDSLPSRIGSPKGIFRNGRKLVRSRDFRTT
jgi:hypothetical protein